MIRPLGKHVLIQIAESEKTTASGFVLPDSAKEKKQYGEIVELGQEVNEAYGIKAGDRVIFKNYTGTEIEHEDATYLIAEYEDIVAVIDDEVVPVTN